MTLHSFTHDHQLDYNDDHMDSGYDDDHEVVNGSCMYCDNSAELEVYENGGGSMSQMCIESFEGDADDEELSNEEKNYKLKILSSDSESGFYSLPATPPQIQRKSGNKYCMNENEVKKCTRDVRKRRRRRMEEERALLNRAENCRSGGVMLIARPKGGRRPMCMDLEEVKACTDLGFELEMPSPVSISAASALDTITSNGENSPIAHSHISSPGDDPQHVKARLKRWAQAVALASRPRPTIY